MDLPSGNMANDRHLDFLFRCLEYNPEYKKEQEEVRRQWVVRVRGLCEESLATMRGVVPSTIFNDSSPATLSAAGIAPKLASRISNKRCLWLVRMAPEDVTKMHISELLNRYNPLGEGLDIVEMAAVFACLPSVFPNDSDGRKKKWLLDVENSLKVNHNAISFT
jgi:hypothetical protein